MPTCERDERNEGTAGTDGVPDTVIPRPRVTACDIVTLRFLPRRESKGRSGAFHLRLETVLGLQEHRNFSQSILMPK